MKEYNLLNLENRQKENLYARIRKWHGLVRMFVHPMYEKWRWRPASEYDTYCKENPIVPQIEKVLAKLLAMPAKTTPPIIIFEERCFIPHLVQWLKHNPFESLQQHAYVIETATNNPIPIEKDSLDDQPWKDLSDFLKELGVKKILIGGMRLKTTTFHPDWTHKPPCTEACVGIAISYLSKKKGGIFNVDISALTEYSWERRRLLEHWAKK